MRPTSDEESRRARRRRASRGGDRRVADRDARRGGVELRQRRQHRPHREQRRRGAPQASATSTVPTFSRSSRATDRAPSQADRAQGGHLVRPLAPAHVGRDEEGADRDDDGGGAADQEQPQRQHRTVAGVDPLEAGRRLARLDRDAGRGRRRAHQRLLVAAGRSGTARSPSAPTWASSSRRSASSRSTMTASSPARGSVVDDPAAGVSGWRDPDMPVVSPSGTPPWRQPTGRRPRG